MLARLLFAILLLLGISLRSCNLDYPALWVDEAESSINALTILRHGYPTDQYVGLPIFENTLVKKWPTSEEYAFQDISYSKGMAVYHGWLPLYSIAASLYLFGIAPDQATDPPQVLHGRQESRLRTMAPRVPSIVFSLIFLVSVYFLAKNLYNREAALATLTATALIGGFINYGRNARYYSATLAFVTLCGLAIWRLTQRQRWRDFVFTGIGLVLLFHTHILSFFIMAIMLAGTLLFLLGGKQIFHKLLLLGFIVGIGTIPWAIYTGFFNAALDIPKAWTLLDFPIDIIRFTLQKEPTIVLTVALGLVWLLLSLCLSTRIPNRFVKPITDRSGSIFFLATWTAIGFFSFLFIMPAASFFTNRLALVMAVPSIMLFSIMVTAACQIITTRYLDRLVVFVVVAVFTATGQVNIGHYWDSNPTHNRHLDLIDIMHDWDFHPGTRIYSTPSDHLIFTYYSGLPVQSIAPVRKSFLNSTESDIFIIDTYSAGLPLPIDATLVEAEQMGINLSEIETKKFLNRLNIGLVRQELDGKVAELWPPQRELSPLEKQIAFQQMLHRKQFLQKQALLEAPILRGYDAWSLRDWWYIFLHRFSDIAAHWRENRNYLDRIRHSTALILPWGWTLYDCGYQGPSIFHSEDILRRTFSKAAKSVKHEPSD